MGLLFGCSALHGKGNAISDVERGDGAFVPFIFPWFQYLLTIRNTTANSLAVMLPDLTSCIPAPLFEGHQGGQPIAARMNGCDTRAKLNRQSKTNGKRL